MSMGPRAYLPVEVERHLPSAPRSYIAPPPARIHRARLTRESPPINLSYV